MLHLPSFISSQVILVTAGKLMLLNMVGVTKLPLYDGTLILKSIQESDINDVSQNQNMADGQSVPGNFPFSSFIDIILFAKRYNSEYIIMCSCYTKFKSFQQALYSWKHRFHRFGRMFFDCITVLRFKLII